MRTVGLACMAAAMAGTAMVGSHARAHQDAIPPQFHGDWVAQKAICDSAPARLRVAGGNLTLINGKDSQTWANVAVPTSFFGPDYRGISVVAIPDFDRTQPFTVYFNENEKKGVTRVEIYVPMQGPTNPQLAKIQGAAKALATRFPVNNVLLKHCPK